MMEENLFLGLFIVGLLCIHFAFYCWGYSKGYSKGCSRSDEEIQVAEQFAEVSQKFLNRWGELLPVLEQTVRYYADPISYRYDSGVVAQGVVDMLNEALDATE